MFYWSDDKTSLTMKPCWTCLARPIESHGSCQHFFYQAKCFLGPHPANLESPLSCDFLFSSCLFLANTKYKLLHSFTIVSLLWVKNNNKCQILIQMPFLSFLWGKTHSQRELGVGWVEWALAFLSLLLVFCLIHRFIHRRVMVSKFNHCGNEFCLAGCSISLALYQTKLSEYLRLIYIYQPLLISPFLLAKLLVQDFYLSHTQKKYKRERSVL